jgi:hypothetical protein
LPIGNSAQTKRVEAEIQDRDLGSVAIRAQIQLIVIQPIHLRADRLCQNFDAVDLKVVASALGRETAD